jgi:8-oxo-dGTP pyrophosphatase MutT (NUDIX family)
MQKIRPLALGILRNQEGRFLFHQARDQKKNEVFYRPLGGGIEFGELGKVAIAREFEEEIGLKVEVRTLLETFENIFEFEGRAGHEIVLLYDVIPQDSSVLQIDRFSIIENGREVGIAVWRTPDEIQAEGAMLYPLGIEQYLSRY